MSGENNNVLKAKARNIRTEITSRHMKEKVMHLLLDGSLKMPSFFV